MGHSALTSGHDNLLNSFLHIMSGDLSVANILTTLASYDFDSKADISTSLNALDTYSASLAKSQDQRSVYDLLRTNTFFDF